MTGWAYLTILSFALLPLTAWITEIYAGGFWGAIDRHQTLIAGIFAVIAAVVGAIVLVLVTRAMIQENRNGEIRQRKARARGIANLVGAELLRRSATLEQKSGGRFNPAIGRLTELWGFHDATKLRTSPPDDFEVQKWLSLSVSSSSLEWDGNMLRSNSPRVMLDLGGIAKGSILEQFVSVVRDAGVENAIIDIGGDLTVVGQVKGRSARIGIRSPRFDEVLGWLEVLDGETVMTSGDYERFFEHDGKRYQHVLDPRTGYPVQETISASVVHKDPVLADAAATALLVAGPGEFEQLCELLGLEVALIVSASGDLRLTRAMEKRLNWPNR